MKPCTDKIRSRIQTISYILRSPNLSHPIRQNPHFLSALFKGYVPESRMQYLPHSVYDNNAPCIDRPGDNYFAIRRTPVDVNQLLPLRRDFL